MTGDSFLDHVADRLAALPGVRAVSLGGSRAQGTHTPDSDWDMAVYYRGGFDPADLRAVGWAGEVSGIGGWGGGVFNGYVRRGQAVEGTAPLIPPSGFRPGSRRRARPP